jgi:hypothetical protein
MWRRRAISVPVTRGRQRYLMATHGQLPVQVSAVTTGEYVALQAGGQPHEVQRRSTATSPHIRQQGPTPAHRASWDDGQTPSGAASSGRRGLDPGARRSGVRSARSLRSGSACHRITKLTALSAAASLFKSRTGNITLRYISNTSEMNRS